MLNSNRFMAPYPTLYILHLLYLGMLVTSATLAVRGDFLGDSFKIELSPDDKAITSLCGSFIWNRLFNLSSDKITIPVMNKECFVKADIYFTNILNIKNIRIIPIDDD